MSEILSLVVSATMGSREGKCIHVVRRDGFLTKQCSGHVGGCMRQPTASIFPNVWLGRETPTILLHYSARCVGKRASYISIDSRCERFLATEQQPVRPWGGYSAQCNQLGRGLSCLCMIRNQPVGSWIRTWSRWQMVYSIISNYHKSE